MQRNLNPWWRPLNYQSSQTSSALKEFSRVRVVSAWIAALVWLSESARLISAHPQICPFKWRKRRRPDNKMINGQRPNPTKRHIMRTPSIDTRNPAKNDLAQGQNRHNCSLQHLHDVLMCANPTSPLLDLCLPGIKVCQMSGFAEHT
jgi:hypothetical protein